MIKKKRKFFLFFWSLSWSSSCFLDRFLGPVLVFLIAFPVEFLFSYFLVFFYKFPPLSMFILWPTVSWNLQQKSYLKSILTKCTRNVMILDRLPYVCFYQCSLYYWIVPGLIFYPLSQKPPQPLPSNPSILCPRKSLFKSMLADFQFISLSWFRIYVLLSGLASEDLLSSQQNINKALNKRYIFECTMLEDFVCFDINASI